MTTKKRKFRIWKIAVPVVVLIALLLGFEHFRLKGLENSLISLVDQQTDGNYRLVIGNSDIDYMDLSINLTDASIVRTAKNQVPEGIDRVEIPSVYLNIGSLSSLLFKQQLVIENFRIAEPIVSLTSKKKESPKTHQPLNLAHEVAQMYPIVEGILARFDIRSFEIRKADLDIKLPESENVKAGIVKLGLISLLIHDWDMKHLSDQSSLRLILEKQKVRIVRSEMAFSSIVYDYHDHILEIHDLAVEQYDTLGRLVFEMENADLMIHKMDFEQLYLNEAYILEELRIDSARLTAHIYPHEVREPAERDRAPVSHLLKENLGTLQLVTGGIFNATVNLVMYQPEDTLQLTIPNMTIKATEFGVSPDSSTLTFTDLTLEANDINLLVEENYDIRIKRLFYDDGINLTLDSLHLSQADMNEDIIRCEQLEMYSFSIFNLLYYSSIEADSLVLRNGRVFFDESAQLPANQGKKKNNKQATTIRLNQLVFDNIDATIDFGEKQVEVKNIQGLADNYIKSPESSSYDLRYLSSRFARYRDLSSSLDISVNEMYFQPRRLEVASIEGKLQGFDVDIRGVLATPENFALGRPFYYHWNTLEIDVLTASGELPEAGKRTSVESKPLNLSVGEVQIKSLDLSLKKGSSQYVVRGGDFKLLGIGVSDEGVQLPEIYARLDKVDIESGDAVVRLENSIINSRDESVFKSIDITSPTATVHVPEIRTGRLTYSDSAFAVKHTSLNDISITQPGNERSSSIDSIVLANVSWQKESGPYAETIAVFGPAVHWKTTARAVGNDRDSAAADPATPFKWIREITVHPGTVAFDEKVISFGKIDLQKGADHLDFSLQDLSFDTGKGVLAVGSVTSGQKNILVENFSFTADPEYVRTMETENDVFDGSVSSIELHEVVWDSLFEHNVLEASSLTLSDASFIISRDKRLPDPPPVRKPFLLTNLIPKSDNFRVPHVRIQNANITYRETGEKTGRQGSISINDINGDLHMANAITDSEVVLQATALLYNTGQMTVNYERIDSSRFLLGVRLTDMPAPLLNQMLDSLEAVKLKSGMISEYDMTITGTDTLATGTSLITYEDLHLEIFKKGSPEQKNLGSELLTLLADGIILRHSKTDAIGQVKQPRIREKGPINFWVKSAIHGAMDAVRKGKSQQLEGDKKRRRKVKS